MRILFLTNFYPPHALGGYEQWCQEVADGLIARGHTLSVLTSQYGVQPGDHVDLPHVRRTLHLMADIDYYRPLDFFLHWSRRERANRRQLRTTIDDVQSDVILVWGMWNLSLSLPYWAEQWLPGRVAYFVSSYWPMDVDPHTAYWKLPTQHAAGNLLKSPLRRLALAQLRRSAYPPALRFDRAVCCSEYVRRTLIAAGKLPGHAGVLLGGSDPAPFLAQTKTRQCEPHARLRLLYFGRLIHDKGVHTAVEALGLLRQRGLAKRFELTILGKGHPKYEQGLRDRAAELAIADLITFVDPVQRDEIPAWLARFDVYLFTSIWPEPMARSVMEAMAAGLLVIGSAVGGQTEMLVHGENALTFQAESVAELADRLEQAWQDPELVWRLARKGQAMVLERFTLGRMVNDIETFLQQVIKGERWPARFAAGQKSSGEPAELQFAVGV